jgi:hypothetical protein
MLVEEKKKQRYKNKFVFFIKTSELLLFKT